MCIDEDASKCEVNIVELVNELEPPFEGQGFSFLKLYYPK